MAKFIALVSHKGPFPADYADQPAPDPAMFGLPTEDDGSRDDPLRRAEHHLEHPLPARLRRAPAASTRIVIAVGADSDSELARRAAGVVAERLGTGP